MYEDRPIHWQCALGLKNTVYTTIVSYGAFLSIFWEFVYTWILDSIGCVEYMSV